VQEITLTASEVPSNHAQTRRGGAPAGDLQFKSLRTPPIAPASSNTRSRTPRRSVVVSSRTLSKFSRHPRT
jgi:hypothetical protein